MRNLLAGLNRSQREAVTHPGGPLLVVAGAGTGKTRTVTARFAWLVEQGATPDEGLPPTLSGPPPGPGSPPDLPPPRRGRSGGAPRDAHRVALRGPSCLDLPLLLLAAARR